MAKTAEGDAAKEQVFKMRVISPSPLAAVPCWSGKQRICASAATECTSDFIQSCLKQQRMSTGEMNDRCRPFSDKDRVLAIICGDGVANEGGDPEPPVG